MQTSRGKPGVLPRTPAGFTALALDGYGLCDPMPARPTSPASYPVSVRRVAILLHASFRRSLAVPPLRFARASPPSGCTGDFHPQDAGHARHTCHARFAGCSLRSQTLTPPRGSGCWFPWSLLWSSRRGGLLLRASHRTGRAGLASGSLDRCVRTQKRVVLTPSRCSVPAIGS